MSSFQPLCSMPHTTMVLLPFMTAMMALVLCVRSLASCDLLITDWAIDCSKNYQSCVYLTELGLGIRSKETLISANTILGENDVSMKKVCQRYGTHDEWLLDNMWSIGSITVFMAVFIALISLIILGGATCIVYKPEVLKAVSLCFLLNAVLSSGALLIPVFSDLCNTDITCDPTELYCVSNCKWGMSGWQVISGVILWTSSAITTWSIPVYEKPDTVDNTSSKDISSGNTSSIPTIEVSDGSAENQVKDCDEKLFYSTPDLTETDSSSSDEESSTEESKEITVVR